MPCKSDQKMEDGDNVLGVDRLNTPTSLDKWAFKMEFDFKWIEHQDKEIT